MKAGVSTACLYPKLLEESVYDLAVNGVLNIEIFINTFSELDKKYLNGIADMLRRFEVTCRSLHPFTCAMEPMMFFSGYRRRVDDAIELYKHYFEAMNILGAEIMVFHGNKKTVPVEKELYFESFQRLALAGREYGVTVAQENVSRCTGGSLSFMKDMLRNLGDDAKFVIDTKQAVRAGENNFDILRTLGSSIVHVHISDHGELGDCLQIGRGRFNIKQFLSILNENSPESYVMVELYRSNFDGISDLVGNYNTLASMIRNLNSQ